MSDAFDPAKVGPAPILSNGNLTLTTTVSSYTAAQTLLGKSTGKLYYEVTVNSLGGTNAFSSGIGKTGADLGTVPGNDGSSVGYSIFDSCFRLNSSQAFVSLGSVVAGSVMCVAVDFANKNVWIRVNAGNWNGVSTDNPATNTGGLNGAGYYAGGLNTLFTGPMFAELAVYNNSQGTINLGATAFAQSMPAGFVGWDPSVSAGLVPISSLAVALHGTHALSGALTPKSIFSNSPPRALIEQLLPHSLMTVTASRNIGLAGAIASKSRVFVAPLGGSNDEPFLVVLD
jgi:hypothetical protein